MQQIKKKKKPRTRIPDLILLLIQLIVSILFIYTLLQFNMIPVAWLTLIFIVIAILLTIFMILMIMKLPRFTTLIKRFVQILLCVGIFVGNFYIGSVTSSFKTITNAPQVKIEKMVLVALNDHEGTQVSDFNNLTIGVQIGNDNDLSEYVSNQVGKNIDFNRYDYRAYSNMVYDLVLGNNDAILLNSAYLKMMEDTVEGFYANYKVIETYTRETELPKSVVQEKLPDEPFVVYISGLDELGEPNQNLNSDVNMLLLVDPIANHITMVTVPRDSYIPNPVLDYQLDKLTHTGSYGVEETVKAAENLFGFDIDYYAKVSFSSLIEIVNTLDGITVNVPVTFCEQNAQRSYAWDDLLCLEEGERFIYGPQTLALARHRASYTDKERAVVQQDIIKAIAKKMMTPTGISRLPDLLSIIPQYVATNMSYTAMSNFVSNEIDQISSWTFDSISMANGVGDNRSTATEPGPLRYVELLSYQDVFNVYDRYQSMIEPRSFSELRFDLNDMSQYAINMPPVDNMIWAEDVGETAYGN